MNEGLTVNTFWYVRRVCLTGGVALTTHSEWTVSNFSMAIIFGRQPVPLHCVGVCSLCQLGCFVFLDGRCIDSDRCPRRPFYDQVLGTARYLLGSKDDERHTPSANLAPLWTFVLRVPRFGPGGWLMKTPPLIKQSWPRVVCALFFSCLSFVEYVIRMVQCLTAWGGERRKNKE